MTFRHVILIYGQKRKSLRGGYYDNKKRKIHESSTNGGNGRVINDIIRFTKPIFHSSSRRSSYHLGSLLRR